MGDNVENEGASTKHPKSVICILLYDFGERAVYTSVKSVLPIYLHLHLQYSKDSTTAIYHLFTMLVYLNCLLGAVTADSWLGKFKTVIYLTLIYIFGTIFLVLSAIPPLELPVQLFTLIGLVCVAIGCGMVKPCISSFGGDQYKMPEQAAQMVTYFSLYVFFMNCGSLIGSMIAPILRDDVKCFGKNHCFPLPFAFALFLLIIAIASWIVGFKKYVIIPLKENVFWSVIKTIVNAIYHKIKEHKTDPKPHWLDYAEPAYGSHLVQDSKTLLGILVLYIPVPVFFALYDQRGSRWIFQATNMDGNVGTIDIKPEHVLLLHPLLLLMLIPLFNVYFYPLLAKIKINTALQKIFTGGIFMALSFLIAAIIEFNLEKTYLVAPTKDFCMLRIFNGIPKCRYTVVTDMHNLRNFTLEPLSHFQDLAVDVSVKRTFSYSLLSKSPDCQKIENQKLQLHGGQAVSYFVTMENHKIKVHQFQDETSKPVKGKAILRVLVTGSTGTQLFVRDDIDKSIVRYESTTYSIAPIELAQSSSSVYIEQEKVWTWPFRTGDLITLLVAKAGNTTQVRLIRLAPPNSISILWLIPQYLSLTVGDVMFSINGMQFTYANAPLSMKAILQGCWQLMSAFGNGLVVIVTKMRLFRSRTYEFLFFAALMFCGMMLFTILGLRFMSKNRRLEAT